MELQLDNDFEATNDEKIPQQIFTTDSFKGQRGSKVTEYSFKSINQFPPNRLLTN